jgi:GntR family transcriptional regulator
MPSLLFLLTRLSLVCILCMCEQHTKKRRKTLKIIISNTSDIPLYQQIKDQIKDAILIEELHEGDPLPSIRSFANDLKVSVLTIRRVYDELEEEGFITSQIGVGTFVSPGNLELLRDSKRRLVEEKMLDMIQTAKSLKIGKKELTAMMDILYEED